MQLEDYYSKNNSTVSFSREQGSNFAKHVAGDFNPIHDIDSKRFCVPGDLLFSLALANFGLSQRMRFSFSGMVSDGIVLDFRDTGSDTLTIVDENGKEYLNIERDGECSTDATLIQNLTRDYVAFSGQTFPHILVPLMSEHNVMINPDRPLVIYESMTIDLKTLAISNPTLELNDASLEAHGKRGEVRLKFSLDENGSIIGTGEKRMLLSGLRAYDPDKVSDLVDTYNAHKQNCPMPL